MELNLELPRDHLFVRRADAHQVVIVDRPFTASIILTRDRVIEGWPPQAVANLLPEHADPILALKPDVVLLGTGGRQTFPTQAVLGAFLHHNIGIEVMDNTAAARTWDILVSEDRNVVAAFILCASP